MSVIFIAPLGMFISLVLFKQHFYRRDSAGVIVAFSCLVQAGLFALLFILELT